MAEPDPDPGARRDRRDDPSALEAAPGLVRIAAGAWWRTAEWSAQSAIRASRRVGRAALTGESPLGLLSDARDEVLGAAQKALGVSELQGRLSGMLGGSESKQPLRERGYELLTRSSELAEQADAHPAYARILSELSPTKRGSCACSRPRGRSPPSTSAPGARSTSARSWSRPASR